MPQFYAPVGSQPMGVPGVVSLSSVAIGSHSHRLESLPVHPVGPPVTFIVQVVAPVTDRQMGRVNALTVMAEVADDLMPVGGKAIDFPPRT
jgi:hypothetical protein